MRLALLLALASSASSGVRWDRYAGQTTPGPDLRLSDGTSTMVSHDWPTNCMDTCFSESACHGFIIGNDDTCHFRGQPADALRKSSVSRRDSTLFLLSQRHDAGMPTPLKAPDDSGATPPPPLTSPQPVQLPSPLPPHPRAAQIGGPLPTTSSPRDAGLLRNVAVVSAGLLAALALAWSLVRTIMACEAPTAEASSGALRAAPAAPDAVRFAPDTSKVVVEAESMFWSWLPSIDALGCTAPRKSSRARTSLGPAPAARTVAADMV